MAIDESQLSAPNQPSAKLMVQETVKGFREIDETLASIFVQMQECAMSLNEYAVVREMNRGDPMRFHSGSALVVFAGIDAPAFHQDKFTANNRRISKRGTSGLRKTGYQVMKAQKINIPSGDTVYEYIIKKKLKVSH